MKRLSPYAAQSADDLSLVGQQHRSRSASDPGISENPDFVMFKVQGEILEMQRKQDVCLFEVQRLSVDQKSIQMQAVELLGKIESSIVALNDRQDNLIAWELDTRNELDSTRKTIQLVTEEMKCTIENVNQEIEHSQKSMHLLAESHDQRTLNLDARTVTLENHTRERTSENSEQNRSTTLQEESGPTQGNWPDKDHRESKDRDKNYLSVPDMSWAWGGKNRKPFRENEFPSGQWYPNQTTAQVNIHISDPPRFEVSRYETFRKEILRWRDIHSSLDDRVLIATLAVKTGDDALKTVMTNFMESARKHLAERNFANMMNVLGKEFARNAYEVSLVKMSLWAGFERKTNEPIRCFFYAIRKSDQWTKPVGNNDSIDSAFQQSYCKFKTEFNSVMYSH